MSETRYLSVRDTAKETGIAEYYIRKHIAQNNVPGFYSGKKFLVDVPTFIARLEVLDNPNESDCTQEVPEVKPTLKRTKKNNEPTLRDILKTELRDVVREELRNIVREELRSILIEELR